MDTKTLPLLFIALSGAAAAEEFTDIVTDATTVLYSIAAGVAIILIIYHAIKWKVSGSSEERSRARKAIINVLLGIILIVIAAALVELLYKPYEYRPAPMLVGTVTSVSSSATELEFDLTNTMEFDMTGTLVTAYALKYSSCAGAVNSHQEDFGNLSIGESATYSYDNFCYETTKFDIMVSCEEDVWQYCAICPSSPGGNCNVNNEPC